MTKQYTDRRWPDEVEYPSLFKVVCDGTPGHFTDEERIRVMTEEADPALYGSLEWTSPYTGATYVAVLYCTDIIAGYRKLRPTEWFAATEAGEVVGGPFKTKRHALHQIHAKSGTYIEAGWYTAKGHDIFRRDMAEHVLGRKLTEEER